MNDRFSGSIFYKGDGEFVENTPGNIIALDRWNFYNDRFCRIYKIPNRGWVVATDEASDRAENFILGPYDLPISALSRGYVNHFIPYQYHDKEKAIRLLAQADSDWRNTPVPDTIEEVKDFLMICAERGHMCLMYVKRFVDSNNIGKHGGMITISLEWNVYSDMLDKRGGVTVARPGIKIASEYIRNLDGG